MNLKTLREIANRTTKWDADNLTRDCACIPGYCECGGFYNISGTDIDFSDDHKSAEYVATFNPKLITKLLDRLEDAEKACRSCGCILAIRHLEKWSGK